jgi:type IV secretory pathway VirD2 relaxase
LSAGETQSVSLSTFNREFLRKLQGARSGHSARTDEDFALRAGKSGRDNLTPIFAKQALSKRLAARIKSPTASTGRDGPRFAESHSTDPRQRAVVKAHYFSHGGGGAAALNAHGKYIDREGVEREAETDPHATYLSREGREGFYGPEHDKVDGRSQLADWAREDPRHFRLILAPEQGHGLEDLRGYVREVMARAEAQLERPLQWVAVNHWNTDNPHTHMVLRGRDGDGKVLGLPREFVKHGLRDIARDVATERLGPRSPDQDRAALDREVRAHRLTRLDRALETHLDPENKVRLTTLGRDNDPAFAQALASRVVELGRLRLAEETSRGTYQLTQDWKERLNALEAHVDIRKQVLKERTQDKACNRALRSWSARPASRPKVWDGRSKNGLCVGKWICREANTSPWNGTTA